MADVKWIKITTNMFEDEKIDFIESLPEADTILIIWIKLLAQAGKTNANGFIFLSEQIPFSMEMFAHKFRRPFTTVKLALDTLAKLGMVEYDSEGFLKISNWEKHQNVAGLERLKEQNRIRQQRFRERAEQKALEEENKVEEKVTEKVTLRNATDKIRLDKSIDIQCNKDVDDFFEDIWKLYPNKKGKSSVSKTQRKKLKKVGMEDLKRAIDNFKDYCEKEKEWYHAMNGSTFFNGRYEDFLHEDEVEVKDTKCYEPKPSDLSKWQ